MDGKLFDLKFFSVYFLHFFQWIQTQQLILLFMESISNFCKNFFMGYTVLALFAKFKAEPERNAGGGGDQGVTPPPPDPSEHDDLLRWSVMHMKERSEC
jgi:hypothetical protein